MFNRPTQSNIFAFVQNIIARKPRKYDEQIAHMLATNGAVKNQLLKQINILANSEYQDDAVNQTHLENIVEQIEEQSAGLLHVQDCMGKGYYGRVFFYLDDVLWPLTTTLSFRYQLNTGKFVDWLHDLNTLQVMCAQTAEQSGSTKSENGPRTLRQKPGPDGKLVRCPDCNQPMIRCEECQSWIKPCFLAMGMTHICD